MKTIDHCEQKLFKHTHLLQIVEIILSYILV